MGSTTRKDGACSWGEVKIQELQLRAVKVQEVTNRLFCGLHSQRRPGLRRWTMPSGMTAAATALDGQAPPTLWRPLIWMMTWRTWTALWAASWTWSGRCSCRATSWPAWPMRSCWRDTMVGRMSALSTLATSPFAVVETFKRLSSLPVLMQKSPWWWQCSSGYGSSPYPPPPGVLVPATNTSVETAWP